jgi:hypothetical protein
MHETLKMDIANALRGLEAERAQLDRQIEAMRRLLAVVHGQGDVPRSRDSVETGQRTNEPSSKMREEAQGMSVQARRAISERMKIYWAKRRKLPGRETAKQGK